MQQTTPLSLQSIPDCALLSTPDHHLLLALRPLPLVPAPAPLVATAAAPAALRS